MLRSWFLEGFKSIKAPTELALGGVTVLTGLNSSGKSSLIQSIRLATQTLKSLDASEALRLNGPDLSLGSFEKITDSSDSGSSDERRAKGSTGIGFRVDCELYLENEVDDYGEPLWRNAESVRFITVDFLAGFSNTSVDSSKQKSVSLVFVRMEIVDRSSPDNTVLLILERVNENSLRSITANFHEITNDPNVDRANALVGAIDGSWRFEDSGSDSISGLHFVNINHFLPREGLWELAQVMNVVSLAVLGCVSQFEWALEQLNPSGRSLEMKIREAIMSALRHIVSDPEEFEVSSLSMNEIIAFLESNDFKSDPDDYVTSLLEIIGNLCSRGGLNPELLVARRVDNPWTLIPRIPAWASSGIETYFKERVQFLGPLRLEPSGTQHYSSSASPTDVGSKGEFAATVYRASAGKPIDYLSPFTFEIVTSSLAEAVNDWLRYLGIADEASTQESEDSGVWWRVRLSDDESYRRLDSVGVGVSQILPIIVGGLIAPAGSLFMVEQPELHLHPRAQAKLAEFFFGLQLTGRQVIVETHSEAMVNAFRLLSVEHELDRSQLQNLLLEARGWPE